MLLQIQFASSGLPTKYVGIFFIFIILYLAFRIYKNTRGMQYNPSKVYRGPIIYLILVFLGMATLNPNYAEVITVVLLIIIGYFIGRKLSGGVKFFEKNSVIYYKRSSLILVIWLISFLARFSIEVIYPNFFIPALITEIILALTTGLILGEAHHIVASYNKKEGKHFSKTK